MKKILIENKMEELKKNIINDIEKGVTHFCCNHFGLSREQDDQFEDLLRECASQHSLTIVGSLEKIPQIHILGENNKKDNNKKEEEDKQNNNKKEDKQDKKEEEDKQDKQDKQDNKKRKMILVEEEIFEGLEKRVDGLKQLLENEQEKVERLRKKKRKLKQTIKSIKDVISNKIY